MRLDDLIIEVRGADYQRVGQIVPKDLNIAATVLFNNVGTWTLSLSSKHYLVDALRTPGSGIVVTGFDGTVLLSGPVTSPAYQATPDDTAGTITFTGITDDTILADRLAYPNPASAEMAAQGSGKDTRTGPAETLMHEYVKANVGPDAPVGRRHPYLRMGHNAGRGSAVTKDAYFDVLGTLLTEISANTRLGFMIRQGSNAGLVFSTYEATDRSATVRLSIQNNALAGLKTTISAPTLTRAILGGSYEATSPLSLAAEQDWGRRIEKFVNASGSSSSDGSGSGTNSLEQQGIQTLADGGMTNVTFEVIPAEDTSMVFGRDWGLGDRVTVEANDAYSENIAAYVSGYAFKASSEEGFIFGVQLTDYLGPDKTAEQQLEERLSYLERDGSSATAPITSAVFEFDNAVTVWNCPHNLGTQGVNVTCYDANGSEVIGDISYPDANTVRISWFYATSGICRITK